MRCSSGWWVGFSDATTACERLGCILIMRERDWCVWMGFGMEQVEVEGRG